MKIDCNQDEQYFTSYIQLKDVIHFSQILNLCENVKKSWSVFRK